MTSHAQDRIVLGEGETLLGRGVARCHLAAHRVDAVVPPQHTSQGEFVVQQRAQNLGAAIDLLDFVGCKPLGDLGRDTQVGQQIQFLPGSLRGIRQFRQQGQGAGQVCAGLMMGRQGNRLAAGLVQIFDGSCRQAGRLEMMRELRCHLFGSFRCQLLQRVCQRLVQVGAFRGIQVGVEIALKDDVRKTIA